MFRVWHVSSILLLAVLLTKLPFFNTTILLFSGFYEKTTVNFYLLLTSTISHVLHYECTKKKTTWLTTTQKEVIWNWIFGQKYPSSENHRPSIQRLVKKIFEKTIELFIQWNNERNIAWWLQCPGSHPLKVKQVLGSASINDCNLILVNKHCASAQKT